MRETNRNRFDRCAIQAGIFCLILLLPVMLFPEILSAENGPKIFGVTGGSIYKEYVNPRWYDSDAAATLARDGGAAEAFSSGTAVSASGRYELVVSAPDGQTTVRFEIDTGVDTALIRTNENQAGTEIEIHFQSGQYYRTPVFAIWAEDIHGNFIQNLYVSSMAATNIMRFTHNEVLRPQAVPYWAHRACSEKPYGSDWLYLAEPELPMPEDLDAVSGATQKLAFRVISRARANEINDSRIKIFFEINQSFDSGWYFSGSNDVREEEGSGTFSSDRYFSGSEEPALVYCVTVDLNEPRTWLLGGSDGQEVALPAGYSHYAGRTGTLYTDFYAADSGTQRYKFDRAHLMTDRITVETFPGETLLRTGDFDRDQDVDGMDILKLAGRPDLIAVYLDAAASSFGIR